MTAVLHRGLLWIKPPAGARECLVLDHYARDRELSSVGELFQRAKYQGDAAAVHLLAEALGNALRDCAPEWSLLRQATRVVAVPSSNGLARALASAVAGALDCPEPEADVLGSNLRRGPVKALCPETRAAHLAGSMTAHPIDGVVVLVDDAVQSTATFEEAVRAVLDAGATQVLCVAAVVIDHVWD